MRVALHISDLHYGTERPEVVRALERLAAVERPAVTILSGDITQRAKKAQFAAAGELMRRIASPAQLVLPGNHDIPTFALLTRLVMPYSRYGRVFGSDLEPVLETPELLVIGVRTTRRYRHIEGEVSASQIERVAQRLEKASPGQLRIVVTHQPVFVTREEDREHLLRGSKRATERWSRAGVDLILGGHIHRPFIQGLHEVLPNMIRPVWVVQAGTAVSSRIRHESNNSLNLIRYGTDTEARHCVVERWDFSEESEAFEAVETRQLALGKV